MKSASLSPLPGILLSLAILQVSCTDSSGIEPQEVDSPEPASVAVAPEEVTVDALGESVQYTFTVWDQLGRVLPNAKVTWYSSHEEIATITPEGLATAVGNGTTTILASASSSVFGWGEMEVTAKPLTILTSTFRPGVLGLPYHGILEGEGFSTPVWSVVEGNLPQGLTLNQDTGEISGTPLVLGTSFFTVQLTAGASIVSKAFSLLIVRENLGVGFGEDQFVTIPSGSFLMGDEDGREEERPVHPVTITEPFMMLKTEVTQHQWMAVMGGNPTAWANCGDLCPVDRVSWEEVQLFLETLNGLDPGKAYRLPTEAEWEYAARAGTTGDFGGTGNPDEMGWTSENSGFVTKLVGQKEPNAWGLYDMHGNLSEWVQDWFSDSYYSVSPTLDPSGPDTGQYKVHRGGSMDRSSHEAKSWYRGGNPVHLVNAGRGFRLVRDPS